MKILKQTRAEQTVVAYTATRDDGNYRYDNTYAVPGTLPAKGTQARATWDAARLVEQQGQYGTWHALMVAPTVPPTKAQLQERLVRARADKLAAEKSIVTLTAAIAAKIGA